MTSKIVRATSLTERWLRGEHVYQFGKSDPIFGDHLPGRLGFLMEDEMPQKWQRQLLFRGQGVEMQASQQLMKVCAAARATVVFSGVLSGEQFAVANAASWKELADMQPLDEGELGVWTKRLSQPFDEAVAAGLDGYTAERHIAAVRVGFQNAARLAIANLCSMDNMALPEPGHTSGEIVSWNVEV